MTQPTDRPGIDQLTSDRLDQLYDELWHLRLAQAGADLALQAACRMTDEQRARAEQAEAEAARLSALAQTFQTNACKALEEQNWARHHAEERAEAILTAVHAAADDLADGTEAGFKAALTLRAILDQHGQTPKEPT